jgi:type II secretory pathway predicted ATPase ExeA
VWKQHWRLTTDPFHGPHPPFVGTSGHNEAVARLLDAIESQERLAIVRGGAGLGKSTVLARVIALSKRPGKRVARVVHPTDGVELFTRLAEGLGSRVTAGASKPIAWRALVDAVRLCRWQKCHVILVVDDAHALSGPADRLDLRRLVHLDPHPTTRVTVIHSVREHDQAPVSPEQANWLLAIRVPPLTCPETKQYISTRLEAAGRSEPVFDSRALIRLHDHSGGSPRAIDRLASLALMAGASSALDRISPDLIDAVTIECDGKVLAEGGT